ncbi:hypothetical protein [Streptomyces fragilis]|uniref:hypothetical protein n=1 Tax=Streptomyces fragilis TaxID=67301 RepID=UPI0024DEBF6B|nr:hypothetical protein [Streptomyces fragilis]
MIAWTSASIVSSNRSSKPWAAGWSGTSVTTSSPSVAPTLTLVSYTHLDVYKRQEHRFPRERGAPRR